MPLLNRKGELHLAHGQTQLINPNLLKLKLNWIQTTRVH